MKLKFLNTVIFASSIHASSSDQEQREREDISYVMLLSVPEAKQNLEEATRVFQQKKNESAVAKYLFKKDLAIFQLGKQMAHESDYQKKVSIDQEITDLIETIQIGITDCLNHANKNDRYDAVNHVIHQSNMHEMNARYWRAKYEEESQAKIIVQKQLKHTQRELAQLNLSRRYPIHLQNMPNALDMKKFIQLTQAKKDC